MSIKTYSEVLMLPTFLERYEYLKLNQLVGDNTFGSRRYLCQRLYASKDWRQFRHYVIARDQGRDLACEGYDIYGKIIIHHINPLTIEDLMNKSSKIFDMENVICVSHNTHEAITYSNSSILVSDPIERKPFDTCPWRK